MKTPSSGNSLQAHKVPPQICQPQCKMPIGTHSGASCYPLTRPSCSWLSTALHSSQESLIAEKQAASLAQGRPTGASDEMGGEWPALVEMKPERGRQQRAPLFLLTCSARRWCGFCGFADHLWPWPSLGYCGPAWPGCLDGAEYGASQRQNSSRSCSDNRGRSYRRCF